MLLNCDLHLHGKYSGGTSFNMELPVLGEQAGYKGLDIMGTSDCLHGRWLTHIKSTLEDLGNGLFREKKSGTKFILQTEVEGLHRIHHVILLPDLEAVERLREAFKGHGNLETDGRPKLRLSGKEILEEVHAVGGRIGPAHAFTPYTAIYSVYDSVYECYGEHNKPDFLELGLSANTELANGIEELGDITFITNSDAHGPWPHRIGREFNRIDVKKASFEAIADALRRGKVSLNVGVPCVYGKYHLSRCVKCLAFYELEDAKKLNWKCGLCGKTIKKGVKGRIGEISGQKSAGLEGKEVGGAGRKDGNGKGKSNSGADRPPYMTITPLAEIVALAIGIKSPTSERVQRIWKDLVDGCGTEIAALVDSPIEGLKEIHEETAAYIQLFRDGKLNYYPGGGGEYGHLLKPGQKKKAEFFRPGQKTLGEY